MHTLSDLLAAADDFVWGPVMLVLLVGTGIFLTVRTRFLPWRNLGYALRSALGREARTKTHGTGDVSPFAALSTALAATIGTGNIVGVATAMVAGGPGALVWIWISAAFGMASKFGECMLAVKYREINACGEMSGGPMYTMKKAIRNKRTGAALGWLFALFAVIASFGIGNMAQAHSISSSLKTAFAVPDRITGILVTVLALLIIVGGIRSISRISSVIVPFMAVFYVLACLTVVLIHLRNVPSGLVQIFSMAFSKEAVTGGFLGTIVASMTHGARFGISRGVFSNEAGMGSAAVTAAAAATDSPVRQGYINMTGTFWDTIVVCTATGLCIAASGMLGSTVTADSGSYAYFSGQLVLQSSASPQAPAVYRVSRNADSSVTFSFDPSASALSRPDALCGEMSVTIRPHDSAAGIHAADASVIRSSSQDEITGEWRDADGSVYTFLPDGTYSYAELVTGAPLTIAAFRSGLGKTGAVAITISIVLFAFSTILGWAYNGEKAWEYLFGTHRYNKIYRILFSLAAFAGATAKIDLVWNFSDIANALMAIPNLICLLLLNGEIARDITAFQAVVKKERAEKKCR